MASQVQIPFEGVILQEHSAPISCPTPNFAKGSTTSLKGVSSMKLHRDLGITQKSAWLMSHRLREVFAEDVVDL